MLIVFGGRCHDLGQMPDIRVGSAPHVLNIVDQYIDSIQCRLFGPFAASAIERKHRQTVQLRIAHDLSRFFLRLNSVLRCK